MGSTQLSELRLGEFSIRSWRFYEIKWFMNKIGVQSNTALPPTFLRNIFYIVNILFFFFRIVLQKLKTGSGKTEIENWMWKFIL